MASIRHFWHNAIDMAAWDLCISRSCRPLVYAGSTYLNAICNHSWDALIYGDYEAVFPLPVKHKWGMSVVYQPFFCQQLGLFAPKDFPLSYSDFLRAIPRRYVKVALQLNPSFSLPDMVNQRCNLLLDLNRPYETIYKSYNKDARKNLRKCSDAGITVESCTEFDEAISLYKEVWGPLNPVLKTQHYQSFENAYRALQLSGEALCFRAGIVDKVLAYAIFFRSPQYLHYVCAAPTAEGRKVGVMHAVIDTIAKTNCTQDLYIDFEGSELPEVAAFYRKFGATEEPYGAFHRSIWT